MNNLATLIATAALGLCASAGQAQVAGLQIAEIAMPHHAEDARIAIWYPAEPAVAPVRYGDNPVFVGVDAFPDAPVAEGSHPVVLFSHGMGGTDRAQAWLGAGLAARGIITVSLNHPNSTWGDFDMAEGAAHWTRALDASVALDAVLAMPAFAEQADREQIMAAGFSFGGWTALSLGGARGNHAGIVAACAADLEMSACAMLLSERVNMQGLDPDLWNASYRDPRVRSVFALDPGFVWGLEASDVAELLPDTMIVGLGAGADRMRATDFDRSGLTALLDQQERAMIVPGVHFSAMPICTAAGPAILAAEEDDPVCTDPEGADRAAIHAQIINMIAARLDR